MERTDARFEQLLSNHDLAKLRVNSGAAYGVWSDFRLAYLNPTWFRFAKDNGGEPQISQEWGLGRSLFDCMSGDVRDYFEKKLKRSLIHHVVWDHEYECSSDGVYRRFHQVVYPLGRGDGLLITNALVVERPLDREDETPDTVEISDYTDSNGFLCQCAYCRRVQNFERPNRWDWVPAWVTQCPEHTSHTFCPTCFAQYFKPAGETGSSGEQRQG